MLGWICFLVTLSINHKQLYRYIYWFYLLNLILLIAVFLFGKTSMGATRWLNLGVFAIQPSELMRISLILSLAKLFSLYESKHLFTAIIITALPTLLILKQPDLGTAILLIMSFFSLIFITGISIKKLLFIPCLITSCFPLIWMRLHAYQKNRILTFINPERDITGAGYHIIQSKISFGSGGLSGLGFMKGTQCHLDFLPEKHTDFIFSVIGEEFGFVGTLIVIFLYLLLIIYNYQLSLYVNDKFSKYLIFGLNSMLFFYVLINISMVCGLLPVVGIALPFLSYGGSNLVILMISEALILNYSKTILPNIIKR